MNIILIDSNVNELEKLKDITNQILPKAIVTYFTTGKEVIDYTKCNKVDVLVCDIHMKDMMGTDLGIELKKINPKLNIIFNTADESFKAKAFDIKASGYIIKPITKEKLEIELNDLRYPVQEDQNFLKTQCFGNFSVFLSNGEVFKFSRTKEKEILAYLIYKRGSEVNIKELGSILFEDQAYDAKQQSYLQQLLFCLGKDLKRVGMEALLVKNYNSIRINPDLVDCDYYRFNDNDPAARNMYNGEFMMQYEWADQVSYYLDSKVL